MGSHLAAQEKVTKEKGTLHGALRWRSHRRVREGWPGFLTGHPCPVKKARTPVLAPFGAFSSSPHRRAKGSEDQEQRQKRTSGTPRLCRALSLNLRECLHLPLPAWERVGVRGEGLRKRRNRPCSC
jgi:hypothetical protein